MILTYLTGGEVGRINWLMSVKASEILGKKKQEKDKALLSWEGGNIPLVQRGKLRQEEA